MRPGQWLDVQHDLAILKNSYGTGGLTNGNPDAVGLSTNRCGGPMAAAQALAERNSVGEYVEVHATRHGNAIPTDKDRPVELRQVFDLLSNAAVTQIALV